MPQVACRLVHVWYGRSVLLILSTREGEAFTEMLGGSTWRSRDTVSASLWRGTSHYGCWAPR